jgi:hypothetical protein
MADVYPTGAGLFDPAPRVPAISPFPADRILSLERVIEYLEEESPIATRIEEILREAQVLDARTEGMTADGEVHRSMLTACIVQAATIHALAESLFEFARGQSQTVADEPVWDRVFAAFRFFGLHSAAFDPVREHARNARELNESPLETDEPPIY